MIFSWDENKINIKKHDISFEDAETVFDDEEAILISDDEHSLDEDRFILLGLSKQIRILVVCHCYREDDESIRIISARKANTSEKSSTKR